MSKFYTNAVHHGKFILLRSIMDGKQFFEKVPFKPTLYVNSKNVSPYKTLEGRSVEPIEFENINEARDFIKQYDDVTDFPIYGNTSFAHQFITKTYPTGVDYDIQHVRVLSTDIEVESDNGFPEPQYANEKILLITLRDKQTKSMITFGTKPFDVSKVEHFDPTNYTYEYCQDEVTLLRRFIRHWSANYPDIVTGWNSQFFDLPYIINRAKKILPENGYLDLSPWRVIKEREVFINNRMVQTYDVYGVTSLDYLDLYKKFGVYNVQESYKLDYIAKQELGREKLKSPYRSYKEFYTKDWNLFVEYNVVDTELVDALEDKMRLVELAITMAYDSRCNYSDVYHAVRLWDCILCNQMAEDMVAPPQRPKNVQKRTIEGGYVKIPRPGRYNHIASIDATSMYPHIMMQWNMSPETYISVRPDVSVGGMLKHQTLFNSEDIDVAIAANGAMFTRESQGLFPKIIEKIFNERVFFKKKMIAAQKEYERTKNPDLLKDISKFNNIQMAKKIQMNSLYGAVANEYFRFYNDQVAEAVTMTGQYIIRSVGQAINTELNKLAETREYDYAFYSDTDSCYVTLEPIINKYFKGSSVEEIIDVMDKLCEDKIQKAIRKETKHIFNYTNSFSDKIVFKRESLCDTGIWTNAKKRYVLNVYDIEGVKYNPPKIKVTGMESNRSSTPEIVRKKLKEALKICLTGDQKQLQLFVSQFQGEFNATPVEQISFPRGVNNMDKYSGDGMSYEEAGGFTGVYGGAKSTKSGLYKKGTPIHVRAAILFNVLVEKTKIQDRHELIRNGDKIKFVYLREPNPLGENIIGFSSTLPDEFGLVPFIDYEKMFEKTFEEPINAVLSVIHWDIRPKASLAFLLGD